LAGKAGRALDSVDGAARQRPLSPRRRQPGPAPPEAPGERSVDIAGAVHSAKR
jgi:hypothetical protein